MTIVKLYAVCVGLAACVFFCSGCEVPMDNPFKDDGDDNSINVANDEGGTVVIQDGKGNTVEVLNMQQEPTDTSVRVTQDGEDNKVKIANVPPEEPEKK